MNAVLIRLVVVASSFAIGVTAAWLVPDRRYIFFNYSALDRCSLPINDEPNHQADISLVYYAVLTDAQSRDNTTPWVVEEMTDGGGDRVAQLITVGFPAAMDTIKDYRLNNKSSSSLRQAIGNHKDVMLYTEKDATELTKRVRGGLPTTDWNKFAHRFRGAQQKYTLSDIGFNVRRDQAFVYLQIECAGGLCAEGMLFILQKYDHQWQSVYRMPLGIEM